MGKYACPCCGYQTLNERGAYDICPVCFWEDDAYIVIKEGKIRGTRLDKEVSDDDLLDVPSGANHGMTLREGRDNYRRLGACEESMRTHVRKPRRSELLKTEK